MEISPATALLRHRILFLSGPVSACNANVVVAGLLLLDADDHAAPIDLYVNSVGGSLADGLAVIDAMQAVRAPVHTVCIGQAGGAAAWVVAAGVRGRRAATRHAVLMLHTGSTGFSETHSAMQGAAQQYLEERMCDCLVRWTGQPSERIRKDLRNEQVFTADEGHDYGLVDRVIEPFRLHRGAVSARAGVEDRT